VKKSVVCIILVFLLLGTAGCTNTPSATPAEQSPGSSLKNTTGIPETVQTPPSPTLSVPETTPLSEDQKMKDAFFGPHPTAETNLSNITFSSYSDTDFSLDYPSEWVIKKSPADYSPPGIFGRDIFKQPARTVSFVSKDNKTKLVATTLDFIVPGNWVMNPDIEWSRNSVSARFPDVSGATAVINYKYFKDDRKNLVATYDVLLPKSAERYPYSYAEKVIFTLHHGYVFDLIAERGDIEEYNNLKYVIFSSIVPHDVGRGWQI